MTFQAIIWSRCCEVIRDHIYFLPFAKDQVHHFNYHFHSTHYILLSLSVTSKWATSPSLCNGHSSSFLILCFLSCILPPPRFSSSYLSADSLFLAITSVSERLEPFYKRYKEMYYTFQTASYHFTSLHCF